MTKCPVSKAEFLHDVTGNYSKPKEYCTHRGCGQARHPDSEEGLCAGHEYASAALYRDSLVAGLLGYSPEFTAEQVAEMDQAMAKWLPLAHAEDGIRHAAMDQKATHYPDTHHPAKRISMATLATAGSLAAGVIAGMVFKYTNIFSRMLTGY